MAINEFDSDRKMMSVLIKIIDGSGQGKIFLLCKGADSSVLPLTAGGRSRPSPYRSDCERHIDKFACQGLRTLVFASRYASTHYIHTTYIYILYIHIHIHIYVIHTYIHTNGPKYTYIHTYIHTYIQINTYIHTRIIYITLGLLME